MLYDSVRTFGLIAASVLCAHAQSLVGTIVDEQQKTVSGAKVTLVDSAKGQRRTGASDAAGSFAFPQLPASTYDLLVERDGFATVRYPGVVINGNDQRSVRIELRVAAKGEAVTVSSESPLVRESPAVATAVSSPPAPAAPTLRRRGSSLAGGSVAGKGAAAAELYYLQQQQQHFKDRADVLLVENMLESYYLQVGQILSRLAVLKERIDDTEDLVNVQLDARRNELVALNLVVTLAMTAFGFVSMIGGLLGEFDTFQKKKKARERKKNFQKLTRFSLSFDPRPRKKHVLLQE